MWSWGCVISELGPTGAFWLVLSNPAALTKNPNVVAQRFLCSGSCNLSAGWLLALDCD